MEHAGKIEHGANVTDLYFTKHKSHLRIGAPPFNIFVSAVAGFDFTGSCSFQTLMNRNRAVIYGNGELSASFSFNIEMKDGSISGLGFFGSKAVLQRMYDFLCCRWLLHEWVEFEFKGKRYPL